MVANKIGSEHYGLLLSSNVFLKFPLLVYVFAQYFRFPYFPKVISIYVNAKPSKIFCRLLKFQIFQINPDFSAFPVVLVLFVFVFFGKKVARQE